MGNGNQTIWGAEFHSETGVVNNAADYNIVENNTFDEVLEIGVWLSGDTRYNIIRNNTILNVWANGINVGSGANVMSGNLIENNIFPRRRQRALL